MPELDWWDSPGYNDFWGGAPGLPPHTKTRPHYGPQQVRSPEELEIGKKYQFDYFNGVKAFSWVILVTGKDEKKFYYEVVSPPEAVTAFNDEDEKYRGKVSFADCSMLPYEKTGLWSNDGNHILRIAA